MEDFLEKRMYFFVPYNISNVQKGIQAGHCALEYVEKYGDTKEYKEFIKNDKTWIILNGGTTNNEFELGTGEPLGTLNKIVHELNVTNIKNATFQEPDLNNALTAVCFIVDERVFNYHMYPDFKEYLYKDYEYWKIKNVDVNDLKSTYQEKYKDWIEFLGGEKNVFLRDLIRNKKLA